MNKTDKELLKLAAKAVGLNVKACSVDCDDNFNGSIVGPKFKKDKKLWSPLLNDGDALRLAVDLDMDVSLSPRDKEVTAFTLSCGAVSSYTEAFGNDKHAATRRAIVRAAAAIGEAME